MSLYTELQLLKAEELVLVRLTSKFNDQLNRLKVEELALLSELREEESKQPNTSQQLKEESVPEEDIDESTHLDLDVKKMHQEEEEEEEEEEEAEASEDPLTAFMTEIQQMQHQNT